jgi:hypothetical protein
MPAARMDEVPKVEPSIAQAKDSAFPKISMIELKQDAISRFLEFGDALDHAT